MVTFENTCQKTNTVLSLASKCRRLFFFNFFTPYCRSPIQFKKIRSTTCSNLSPQGRGIQRSHYITLWDPAQAICWYPISRDLMRVADASSILPPKKEHHFQHGEAQLTPNPPVQLLGILALSSGSNKGGGKGGGGWRQQWWRWGEYNNQLKREGSGGRDRKSWTLELELDAL